MELVLAEYKESPDACAACGSDQTHHLTTFCIESVVTLKRITFAYLYRSFLYRKISGWIRRHTVYIDRVMYGLMQRVGIISFSDDSTRSLSYRSEVVWEEAKERGIRMQQVVMFKKYTDIYRALVHNKWFYFEALPIPSELDQSGHSWIDDKVICKEFLASKGIPIISPRSVITRRQALRAFERIGAPVITKPRSGSLARHTTTCITNIQDVIRGFESAHKLCAFVSVERHIQGGVSRGTVVGGKLVGFFQAFPPRVIGDGQSTITELVNRQNAHKHPRINVIHFTSEHIDFLARAGYSIDSVLENKKTIDLFYRTGRSFGGETREMLNAVHPKLREYLEKSATLLRVPIVGFDLIIQNPEINPDTQEWSIIEANSLPFIDLHYLPLHGKPSNTAAAVWDLWNL